MRIQIWNHKFHLLQLECAVRIRRADEIVAVSEHAIARHFDIKLKELVFFATLCQRNVNMTINPFTPCDALQGLTLGAPHKPFTSWVKQEHNRFILPFVWYSYGYFCPVG